MCIERTDRNGKTYREGDAVRHIECVECGKYKVLNTDLQGKLHDAQVELMLRSDRIITQQMLIKELYGKVQEQARKIAIYEHAQP